MTLDEDDWDELLTDLNDQVCTPIIGHGVYTPRDRIKEMVARWAREYEAVLEESRDLAKVSQFLAIDRGEMYPKKQISNIIRSIEAPDFSLEETRNNPYRMLADFNLPIYITTNYDKFMEAALRSRGKDPVTEICRWNEYLQKYLPDAGFTSIFEKEKDYTPSTQRPLVFHLHGVYDEVQSIVMTEKDYIDFVASLNRLDEKLTIPEAIRRALLTTPLLFVGYSLKDIAFRVIFQGVTSIFGVKRSNLSIAVQLESKYSADPVKKAKVEDYLSKYTKNMYEIVVYWGSTDKFVTELRDKLDEFRRTKGFSP